MSLDIAMKAWFDLRVAEYDVQSKNHGWNRAKLELERATAVAHDRKADWDAMRELEKKAATSSANVLAAARASRDAEFEVQSATDALQIAAAERLMAIATQAYAQAMLDRQADAQDALASLQQRFDDLVEKLERT
jgi:hypothetical protein